jgi:hypothetical protein
MYMLEALREGALGSSARFEVKMMSLNQARWWRTGAFVALLTLLWAPEALAGTCGVLPFEAVGDVARGAADNITAMVSTEADVRGDFELVLTAEEGEADEGCGADPSCIKTFGRGAGHDQVITGSIKAVGDQYQVTSQLWEVRNGRQIRQVRHTMDRSADVLIEAIPNLVVELLTGERPDEDDEPRGGDDDDAFAADFDEDEDLDSALETDQRSDDPRWMKRDRRGRKIVEDEDEEEEYDPLGDLDELEDLDLDELTEDQQRRRARERDEAEARERARKEEEERLARLAAEEERRREQEREREQERVRREREEQERAERAERERRREEEERARRERERREQERAERAEREERERERMAQEREEEERRRAEAERERERQEREERDRARAEREEREERERRVAEREEREERDRRTAEREEREEREERDRRTAEREEREERDRRSADREEREERDRRSVDREERDRRTAELDRIEREEREIAERDRYDDDVLEEDLDDDDGLSLGSGLTLGSGLIMVEDDDDLGFVIEDDDEEDVGFVIEDDDELEEDDEEPEELRPGMIIEAENEKEHPAVARRNAAQDRDVGDDDRYGRARDFGSRDRRDDDADYGYTRSDDRRLAYNDDGSPDDDSDSDRAEDYDLDREDRDYARDRDYERDDARDDRGSARARSGYGRDDDYRDAGSRDSSSSYRSRATARTGRREGPWVNVKAGAGWTLYYPQTLSLGMFEYGFDVSIFALDWLSVDVAANFWAVSLVEFDDSGDQVRTLRTLPSFYAGATWHGTFHKIVRPYAGIDLGLLLYAQAIVLQGSTEQVRPLFAPTFAVDFGTDIVLHRNVGLFVGAKLGVTHAARIQETVNAEWTPTTGLLNIRAGAFVQF